MDKEQDHAAVKSELDALTAEFFHAVSFVAGGTPPYQNLYALFIEPGLLIKNTTATPEISTVRQFIEPRQAMVSRGELTRFRMSGSCQQPRKSSATSRIATAPTRSRAR
ncbi:hypothetical protein LP416_13345 [Polaromonas sp. P2-4]|nr:hypothetical protein LP416_13345 [Polaromonas sp. P2-4]